MQENDTPIGLQLLVVGLLLAGLVAPAVLVIQGFFWLKSGFWPAFNLLDALYWLNVVVFGATESTSPFTAWLAYPESWLGFHKILAGTPISLAIACMGLFLSWLSRFFKT